MPAKFEQYGNNAVTNLNGTINDSTTSVVVDSVSQFPSDGNFHIKIDNELMLVTSISSLTFTVVRAAENTVAAFHSDNSEVALIVTKESFQRLAADHIPFFGFEGTPGPLNSMTDDSGTDLTSSDFAWINQGSATITDLGTSAGLLLKPPVGTGSNLRIFKKSAPSTPYTVYGAFSINLTIGSSVSHGGLCFRESGTGKVKLFALSSEDIAGVDTPSQMGVGNYNSPTSFNSWDREADIGWNPHLTWLEMTDNGTNLIFRFSSNGLEFQEFHSETRGTFFTTAPDEIGIYMNVNDASIAQALLLNHWSEQ